MRMSALEFEFRCDRMIVCARAVKLGDPAHRAKVQKRTGLGQPNYLLGCVCVAQPSLKHWSSESRPDPIQNLTNENTKNVQKVIKKQTQIDPWVN